MIQTKEVKLQFPFSLSLFSEFANQEDFFILHSGGGGLDSENWTIIGLNSSKYSEIKANQKIDLPITHGQIGYLAYPNIDLENDIPAERFRFYDSLFLYHSKTKKAFITYRTESQLIQWQKILNQSECCSVFNYSTSGNIEISFTKTEYIQKIKKVKELLAAGEIYQLNFALRFRKKFSGNPYGIFLKLVESNPSDFQSFLNCGDFQIISASPERLFKVKDQKIITQPIKGTARKTIKSRKDPNLKALLESEKERAELDMITDLERNDIGKICEYGTLKINEERGVMELPNIWHCYSEVEGKLNPYTTPNQIIKAMFPGGSITGCPKKRAMEYISKLEGLPRNIFTGSIGYVSGGRSIEGPIEDPIENHPQLDLQKSRPSEKRTFNGNMDFNICIRTALIKDGYLEYWSGGAIVADSDPEKEYEEVMLKAEKFLNLI